MGHRVLGPAVARLQVDGGPAGGLGGGVVAGLLQPEGVQAQYGVIARHVGRPVRTGPADPVAQHGRVAGQEVEQLADLQGQRIARILFGDLRQQGGRLGEPPLDHGAQRRHMAGLAVVGGQGGGGGVIAPRGGQGRRVRAGGVQIAEEDLGHHEGRTVGDRRAQPPHRIADEPLMVGQHRVVQVPRHVAGAGRSGGKGDVEGHARVARRQGNVFSLA